MAENTLVETLKSLRDQVDKTLIKQRDGYRDRQGNTHSFDYVEWHTVANILDDKAPAWSHTVKDIQCIGDVVVVIVAITIGGVTREGIGTGAADTELGIKKAEHDALKRAAVKFGVARELYKKESEVIDRGGAASNNVFDINSPPQYGRARGVSDLLTSKQIGMLRALARNIGVDLEEECQGRFECPSDELSKRAASWLIQYFQEQEKAMKAAAVPDSRPRNETGAKVSPETKGKLLFDDGRVKPNSKGFTVTETVEGKTLVFDIAKNGEVVSCTCGEYRETAAKNPHYLCAHKYAWKFYKKAQQEKTK